MSIPVPKFLIVGDETIQTGIQKLCTLNRRIQCLTIKDNSKILFKVRMEKILGQPTRSVLCTRFTSLSEELSKVTNCAHTKVIAISCLSSIVEKIMQSSEIKAGLERAMLLIGNMIHEVHQSKKGSIRILVAPCTPRRIIDYNIHSRYAMVLADLKILCYR